MFSCLRGLRRSRTTKEVVMKKILFLLLLATACCTPGVSRAGWGGGCGPVGPVVARPAAPEWHWRPVGNGWLFLDHFGEPVACYHPRENEYRERDGAGWSDPKPAPWLANGCRCGCPACGESCRCRHGDCGPDCSCGTFESAAVDLLKNPGVMADQLHAGKESYKINGREVPKRHAMQAIAAGGLTDDSAKPHLTLIGTDAETAAAVAKLDADARAACLVQCYPPDHWAVQPGFQTGGHPEVYLQDHSGKVLWHAKNLNDIDGLAGAIRKADPRYNPGADPGPGKGGGFKIDLSGVPLQTWLLAAAAGAVVFLLPKFGKAV